MNSYTLWTWNFTKNEDKNPTKDSQFYMIYLYYPKRNEEDWISVQQKEIKRLQAKNVELSRKRQKMMNEKDDIRLARVEIKSLKELNQKLTDSNEGMVLYYLQ